MRKPLMMAASVLGVLGVSAMQPAAARPGFGYGGGYHGGYGGYRGGYGYRGGGYGYRGYGGLGLGLLAGAAIGAAVAAPYGGYGYGGYSSPRPYGYAVPVYPTPYGYGYPPGVVYAAPAGGYYGY